MYSLKTVALFFLASYVNASPVALERRSDISYPTFASSLAANYHVITSSLPLFNGIDVQDSWAGRVPGSGLFFWYFPSSQSGGSDTLSIWLNGGPGCSSLTGATKENGPFTFVPGTTNPVVNAYGWTTEQPAGVGYSTGSNANLTGEIPLADSFYVFLQSFYGVFAELATKRLFLTGESYAGFYIPVLTFYMLYQPSELMTVFLPPVHRKSHFDGELRG
ncbi:hypothetical protein P7C70_g4998, partial [Phenoliferia sp. Uapishka_3]